MRETTVSVDLESNYKDYYEDGDSEWRRLGAIGKVENILSLCRDLPRENILEIGAGEGAILRRLSELHFGEKLYALEISPSGVEAILGKQITNLTDCKVFDGYHVPYEDDRFDIVILSHVLEHVEHPRLLLYEATRVARYVFVEVPLEDTIRRPMDFIFDAVGHINDFSPKSIRRLIQSCRLRIVRQITTSPAKDTYTFKKGRTGLINYYVKSLLLSLFPSIATRIFTYHAAIISERDV